MVGRYPIATPVVDIESIGTGGGSIAWLDEDTGGLRVGPRSAGADPGPACYGRGGIEPTVTDAAAVLGYLESLGGRLSLDVEAAEKAIDSHLATPMGVDVRTAAEGVLRVANAQMADLVRRVTVQRGHDPRDAVLYAFGGAAPQYAGRYAADLGAKAVVIPANAAVFSAFGAVATDLRATAALDAPRSFPPSNEWAQDALTTLEEQARRELGSGDGATLKVERWAGMRFRRQVHELRVDVPNGPVADGTFEAMATAFVDEYERLFGAGTAYRDAGLELVGLRVEVASELPHPEHLRSEAVDRAPVRTRAAWFDGVEHQCPLYDGDRLAVGFAVEGPAFIEMPTTTVTVYPGQSATVDEHGHVTLDLGTSQ
jgi:N-methylhydantoinase A